MSSPTLTSAAKCALVTRAATAALCAVIAIGCRDNAAFVLAYLVDKAVRAEAPTTTLADALLGERMVNNNRR